MKATLLSLAAGNAPGQSSANDDEEEGGRAASGDAELAAFAAGLLSDESLTQRYAVPLIQAALHGFCETTDAKKAVVAEALCSPLAGLSDRQPLVTSQIFKEVVDTALEAGLNVEPLVQLVAPACAAVQAEGDSKGAGTFVPMVQAFSHKTDKVRCDALAKAVADLESSKGKEDEQRQRLLASLALQTVQDESVGVACQALQLKSLWASLPQAKPDMTVPTLEALLAKELNSAKPQGDTLQAMFSSVLLKGPPLTLVPAAINCCAWVYSRKDCKAEMRNRIDVMLLPLLVFAAVGLDLSVAPPPAEKKKKKRGSANVDQSSESAGQALRTALLSYCGVSEHGALAGFAGGEPAKAESASALGPLSMAIARAIN